MDKYIAGTLIGAAATIAAAIIGSQLQRVDVQLHFDPPPVTQATPTTQKATIEQIDPKPSDGTRPSADSLQQSKRDEAPYLINTPIEWRHQECRRATQPSEKFGNDKPSEKDELIKNSNFGRFYQPEWIARIHDKNANIQQFENFVRIFFDGEGTNSKAVELYQIAKVSDPKDLIFNLRIKISDFANEGFPVAALTLIDHSDKKAFQIIFTPDKHWDPEANDYLYPIRSGSLEDITISPLECVGNRLSVANYEKIIKAKVSFYIVVPSGYLCRSCTIEVHNVSLAHGQRRD